MTDLSVLEQRVKVLEDIESIRQLRHRFWRYVRQGLWREVSECFTPDGVLDLGPEKLFRGKSAIGQFEKEWFASTAERVPQGHNAEIEITGNNTAKAVWVLDVFSVDGKTGKAARSGALYEDVYEKDGGEWKIKYMKTVFLNRHGVETEGSSQQGVHQSR